MTLHGALDDATGAVLALHFRPAEDLHGYAAVLETVFTTWGLAVACYGDGTNILVRNDPHWSLEEELRGAQTTRIWAASSWISASGTFGRGRRKPRAASNGSGGRCKIGSSSSSACRA